MSSHRFRTTADDAGLRLDQVLAAHVPGLSRTRARAALAEGGVFVDGHRTKVASRAVKPDQDVRVHLAARLRVVDGGAVESTIPIPTLHEDEEVMVVEKPAGMFSAPTPESDRNNLLALLERRHGSPLHLVHRLDRPTSGLMVFAKNKANAAALGHQLQIHDITRTYLAIVRGPLEREAQEVDLALDERPARTRFTRLAVAGDATLVRAELYTGRTHQVRRHAEFLGHPILGDSKYGRPALRGFSPRPPRMCLHAETLAFTTASGRELSFRSPLPDSLDAYWRELGGTAP
ncbi:MAG TPA: RluA family pseudouridine synthase [Polyangiaceae bacterium]|nr:RluA family pseudouridine synthase [Polyangiaceae bacterium]